jgi:hypothetical protein
MRNLDGEAGNTQVGQVLLGPNNNVNGDRNCIIGPNARVRGNDNEVVGPNAQVWGNRNRITGPNAQVMSGNDNVIMGPNGRISGGGTGNRIEYSGSVVGGRSTSQVPRSRKRNAAPAAQRADVVIMGSNHGVAQVNLIPPDKKSRPEPLAQGAEETQYVRGPPPSDIKHDRVAEEGAIVCAICLERAACCVASPCMHACYCVACSRHLCFGESGADLFERGQVKCAKCREPVHSIKHIFI